MSQKLIISLVQRDQLILPAVPVEGDDFVPGFGTPGIKRLPGQNKSGILTLKLGFGDVLIDLQNAVVPAHDEGHQFFPELVNIVDNPYTQAHVGARHVQRPDVVRNLLLLVHHLNPDVVLRVIKREVVFQTVFPAAVRAPVLKQRSGDCLIHGIGQLIVNAPVYHHVDPLDALGTKEMYPFRGSHFSTLLSRSNSFERNAPVPAAPAGACYRYFIKQRKRMQEKASES